MENSTTAVPIRRWQVIAELVAALERLYPSGTCNEVVSAGDIGHIEDVLSGKLDTHLSNVLGWSGNE